AVTTTTSTTVAVDQIPPVITVEYAQRVMDALDKAFGEMTRMIYEKKVPTPDWHERLVALLDRQAFSDAETQFGRDAADDFEGYRNPPGDPVTIVRRVYDSTATCAALEISRDCGPQYVRHPSPELLQG